MHKEDSLYPEAYEKVLDAWMTFVQGEAELPKGTLQPHAIQVFNAYLQCHLSPPDGTRNQVSDAINLTFVAIQHFDQLSD